jgi:hypothetical protein
MRHILSRQSDGGHVCERCGAVFDPYARLADIMQRPCKGETPFTWDGGFPTGTMAGPYTVQPYTPNQETDTKGNDLVDRWLKERDDGQTQD